MMRLSRNSIGCNVAVMLCCQPGHWGDLKSGLRQWTEQWSSPDSRGARVVIADDNDLARAGLQAIVCSIPRLELVGEASGGRQAVALCQESAARSGRAGSCACLAWMGLAAACASSARWRPRRVIILITVHNKLDYLLDAVQVGASGYLLKDASRKEIVTAVRRVIAGELLNTEGAELEA